MVILKGCFTPLYFRLPDKKDTSKNYRTILPLCIRSNLITISSQKFKRLKAKFLCVDALINYLEALIRNSPHDSIFLKDFLK